MNVLLRVALRDAWRHPAQPLLAIVAVALGVAVVVGVELVGVSANRAFDGTVESLTGRATHRVVAGPGGLDEALYAELRTAHGVRAAPVVEGSVRRLVAGRRERALRVVGIDPFAEVALRPWFGFANGAGDGYEVGDLWQRPGAALLSARTAAELGIGAGDSMPVQAAGVDAEILVVGVIAPRDPVVARGLDDVLITDIATAQELLREIGRLDRIDLQLAAGDVARVAALLPAGVRLQEAAAQRGVLASLTRAFRLNLRALGLLALVVGAFLVHNALQLLVVQRRALLGVLRAVGAGRRQVFTTVLAAALLIGTAGTLVGVGLGTVLAQALLGTVGSTIAEMYASVSLRDVRLDPLTLAVAAALGLGASLVAALVPAVEATRVPPRAALQRSDLETRSAVRWRRAAPIGLALCGIGLFAADRVGTGIAAAYLAVFAFLLGCALLAPGFTVVLLAVLERPLARGLGSAGAHAARSAAAGLSRTAVAVAALALAVSATVGLGAMITSFRGTVATWLETTLNADVYVSVPASMSDRTQVRLLPAALAAITALPSVQAGSTYRRVEVETTAGERVELAAIAPAPGSGEAFAWIDGDPGVARAVLEADDGVLISEPLGNRLGLGRGDRLTLIADRGALALPVRGVFRDYASERGYAVLSRTTYDAAWDDRGVTSVALWADAGTTPAELARQVRAAADDCGQEVVARADDALRLASLEVFDRTFAVTGVLRILCAIVAFVGVLGALTALQLERRREAAVLRAIGATPAQVARGVVAQNVLLGLGAGLWAIPGGIGLAWLLVDVVNRRSFGWTMMQFSVPPSVLVEALGLALVAATLAGLWPALRLARQPIARALREE